MRLPTRLALVGVATLAVTLAAVALLTWQLIRVSGRQDVDDALRGEAGALATGIPALLAEDGDGTAATTEDLRRAAERYLALNPGSSRHLTVIEVGGQALATGDGPPELVRLRTQGALPEGEPGRLQTVDTPEGPVRTLTAALVGTGGDRVGTTTVAGSLNDARDQATTALARIGVAGIAGLVLGGAALTAATRRSLAPATALADAARSAGGGDLGHRVPEPERDDEIGTLAREFNRMLDRMASATEDRRRLLSAVSHELRTPLAVAQGHLEVYELGDGAGAAELAEVVRAELGRLTRVVDDLAALTHGEGGPGYDVEVGPTFAPDVMDDLRSRVTALGLDAVVIEDAPPVVVEADQDRLAQSLLNLVLNADTHTPAGTAVRVAATRAGGRLEVSVADDGPGIDPAVRDRVFEPFVTTRTGGPARRSGLGLALVRSLTEAQGGTVGLATGPDGTTVTLSLRLSS